MSFDFTSYAMGQAVGQASTTSSEPECKCSCHDDCSKCGCDDGAEPMTAIDCAFMGMLLYLTMQAFAFVGGAIESAPVNSDSWDGAMCREYPKTRAGYLVPGFWAGCKTGQFFKTPVRHGQ